MLAGLVTTPAAPFVAGASDEFPWYALRTRSNFEKTASTMLAAKGYQQYLPIHRQDKRWSDRAVRTELPLFPGYVFCRFDPQKRIPILSTAGVVAIVGFGTEPAPIPDHEIEAVQRVVESGLAVDPCSFISEGERIRIKRGPLANVEGVLLKRKSGWRMVVSVPMLLRSVSVEIDAGSVGTI